MKTFLKSLLFFISVVGLFVFTDPGLYDITTSGSSVYYSLFTPEIIHNKSFEPFFYTHSFMLYGTEKRSPKSFNEQNILDWKGYFENKIDSLTIGQLLYKTKLSEIDTLIFFLKNPTMSVRKSIRENKILTYDDKNKTLDFLFYLGYALRCEVFANVSSDDWSYNDELNPSFAQNNFLLKLIKGGMQQQGTIKNDFVRERYLFQLIRLLYFNEEYTTCQQFFNSNRTLFIHKSVIYYRAMGYVAAALYKQQVYSKANYYYSLIFDNCPLMKESALLSFHPIEENDFAEALALAKNVQEKTTLLFLMGYEEDNLRGMKAIKNMNPTSPYMELLLTRAINKVEDNLLEVWASPNLVKNDEVDVALVQFIQQEASNPQNKNVAIWNLALGYLYILTNNQEKAKVQLIKASRLSNDLLFAKSVKLYQAINQIQAVQVLDEKTELQILTSLQVILKEEPNEPYLRKIAAQNWVKRLISSIYKKQNELLKAQCFLEYPIDQYFKSQQHLEDALVFKTKKPKNAYEKYLQEIFPFNKDKLLMTKGVLFAYSGDLAQSVTYLEQAPSLSNDILLADPFTIHINDCQDCDHNAPKKESYTSLSFLKKMQKYLKQAESTTNSSRKATLYFEIANGYYNMTLFGNARDFSYNIIFNVLEDRWHDYYYDNGMIETLSKKTDCSLAATFYQKALETSTDKEFSAKCTFMLAKCEQNAFFTHKDAQDRDDFKAGKFFADLKNTYRETTYFKEIIQECGYFKTYFKKVK